MCLDVDPVCELIHEHAQEHHIEIRLFLLCVFVARLCLFELLHQCPWYKHTVLHRRRFGCNGCRFNSNLWLLSIPSIADLLSRDDALHDHDVGRTREPIAQSRV